MKDIEVLVIGRACVDYLAVVPHFPSEDQKVQIKHRLIEAGGQGSTASCCISRLGGKTRYVGRVGDDDEGRFCLKRLKDFEVNTDYVKIIKNGKTPVAYIFVTETSGKRTIIYEPYTLPEMETDRELIDLLSGSKVMFLDPEVTYLAKELRQIKDRPKIVYDCERWKNGIDDMFEVADYFIPSSVFLKAKNKIFKGEAPFPNLFTLNEMTKGKLVVTDGQNGAYYIEDDKLFNIQPPKIDIKDTIGAGDNFHGAFAFAVSRNFTLPESVKFAVAVASLSCREFGGREGLPSFEEARKVSKGLDITPVNN